MTIFNKKEKNKTLVNFILDKSGSMETVKQATISGFNEYVGSLKKDKNSEFSFSLTLFDTQVQKPYLNVSLADVKDLNLKTYIPNGMTALYDAVCQTIAEVKKQVDKDTKVLTVILTDGEENSSKEYSQEQLKSTIEGLQNAGNWSFVFLGANQDAWLNAQKFGILQHNAVTFSASTRGVHNVFAMSATNTSNFAMNATIGNAADYKVFTDDDKEQLKNAK